VGHWADLVTLDLGSVRTAGTAAEPESVVFAATAADVTHVVGGGRPLELGAGDVGAMLADAIADVRGAA
jgi:cytosine/adenosine deaminase-related metal-dependent hydrolase